MITRRNLVLGIGASLIALRLHLGLADGAVVAAPMPTRWPALTDAVYIRQVFQFGAPGKVPGICVEASHDGERWADLDPSDYTVDWALAAEGLTSVRFRNGWRAPSVIFVL